MIDLRIPKLREDAYFPDFSHTVHERPFRAVRASGATVCAGGVDQEGGGSGGDPWDRVFVEVAGVGDRQDLNELVDDFRNRPLDRGLYTYVVGRRPLPQSQKRWPVVRFLAGSRLMLASRLKSHYRRTRSLGRHAILIPKDGVRRP